MSNADSIIASICGAFADTKYPGDGNLIPKGDRLAAEVAAAFRGKIWQTVSRDEVCAHCDDLALMTPLAFHYFIPAYMVHCLRTPLEVNTACTSVVHDLTPPNPGSEVMTRWWSQRIETFNAAQREVIVAFLEHRDQWERDDWAKMGKDIKKTGATKALAWWREREDEQGPTAV